MRTHLQQVVTPVGLEVVRRLRNDCRQFMTRHTAEISKDAQRAWWEALDHSRCQLFALAVDGTGARAPDEFDYAGYGLIRTEPGKDWLSGGLSLFYRGHGLGKRLFWSLMALCEQEIWLEVRFTNERARQLYRALGFQVVQSDLRLDGTGVVETMTWRGVGR